MIEKINKGLTEDKKPAAKMEEETKMKRKATLLMAGLAAAFTLGVSSASAAPIELFTDQISKLKFVNYENLRDVNQNAVIDAGDVFYGILNVEAITNISGSQDLSAQLVTKELTGFFQISVVGGAIPFGGPGHVDFGLLAGDFIDLWVGTGATKNWDPTSISSGIVEATDGALWASITGNTGFGYEGINDTIISPFSISVNRNWADLDVNNTGYPILKEFYSSAAGEPSAHTYGLGLHGDHFTDVYFASRLFFNTDPNVPGWQFRSEDPVYVHATPEPATFLLFGAGLVGLGLAARRRLKK